MAQRVKPRVGPTWGLDVDPPPRRALGPIDFLRVLGRGLPLLSVLLVGVVCHAIVRLFERALSPGRRVVSPWITVWVCRIALLCLGLTRTIIGRPAAVAGAAVANHASWLDIFVLNAGHPLTFVSKAEVAGWPGIGLLARITGTVFIRRDRSEAKEQTRLFETRLAAGDRLLFFPEGTSTDGRQVLPFMPTLFQAVLAPQIKEMLWIQPISVLYRAPKGADARYYGWWGEMEFAAHCLDMLATPRHGSVQVMYHPPVRVSDYSDRKALARALHSIVTSGVTQPQQAETEPGSTAT